MVSCIEWKSKCVVMLSDFWSLAGCCTGQKSYTFIPFGTTTIPPGCCPVVRFTPVQPAARRDSSALCRTSPLSSSYFFTKPMAVFSATVAMVPALKTLSLPKSFSVYLCACDWYSPEKLRSMSGVLSPSNPKNVSNGIVCPSRLYSVPQTGHFLGGRSKPLPTLPSVINSLCLQLGHM